jgi:multiple sugar transport system substrate-binding protein
MLRGWKIGALFVGLLLVVGIQLLAAGPIKITFNTQFHEADAQAMEDIINLFNETHDDIQVELIQGGWTQWYAELRLSVIAGNPPQLGVSHINKLVEMVDYYTPLNASPVGDLLTLGGIEPGNYTEANWVAGQLGGNQYMVPLDTHGWGIWYNKSIFEEVGLDPDNPPQTLGAFMNACEAIKDAGYYAWHPAEDSFPRKLRRAWYVFFWQMGGELFDPGYTEATFNNPKGLLALQFLVDIFNDFGWNVPGGNGPNQFVAGKLGMLIGGNWYYGLMASSDVDWAYMKMPNFFGSPYSWGNSHQLVVPVQPAGTLEEVYAATMEVLRFVTENSHIWTQAGGHITANLQEAKNPELMSSAYWIRSGQYLNEMAQAGLIHFPINNPKGSQLESAIQTNIELAVNGEISPQVALDRAEEECNTILQSD